MEAVRPLSRSIQCSEGRAHRTPQAVPMARVDGADSQAAHIPGYRRAAHRHVDDAAQHDGVRSWNGGSGIVCTDARSDTGLFSLPTAMVRGWLRGRWHTTQTEGVSHPVVNGEVVLWLRIRPPLDRSTTWIDVMATGQSAEARATLPLRWK